MSAPPIVAPIHKNRATTLGRISGFISKTSIFNIVNLSSKLYSDQRPLTSIDWWALPGGPGSWKNFTFRQVVEEIYASVDIGDTFGPLWTTHWFKIVITVPDAWAGKEVHLRWISNCEATIWRDDGADGQILQGISPDFREEYVITKNWEIGGPITLYVEMACNNMFGSGDDVYDSEITPPDPNKYYTLKVADIATWEPAIFKLYTDLEILYQIANHSSLGSTHKGYQAMFAANQMVTLIEEGQMTEAGALADQYFAAGNGQKAYNLISMGHCHIDTAWLWPYDETIRKCVRSWSSQIRLMEEYPDFVFVASQAQQYAWMKQYYPAFYTELTNAIESGQFYPVGGTWVEMDGNVPNGESFMRQFFYGQRFFRQEFGITCREFWLPDTFGYSAQIPQMTRHVGINRFLTQKLSWSLVNKFPNHNFWWEGIDGSQVLCHFPPGDTYNMRGDVDGAVFSESNSQDKGRANVAAYLFGVGDGGGGPTRTFIERQRRLQNVDGVPKIQLGTPEQFWLELEKESSKFYKWVGELYLELHNATYTTQSKIKWYNRKCEMFFREVELQIAIALTQGKITEAVLFEDIETVDVNWKQFLLNQFHDVLPGSCIQIVAEDAWQIYADIFTALSDIRSKYNDIILGATGTNNIIYNPLNWAVETVIFNQGAGLSGPNIQNVEIRSEPIEDSEEGRFRIPNAFTASLVDMASSGYSVVSSKVPTNPVSYTSNATTGTLSNGLISLQVSLTGFPTETMTFRGALSGRENIAVYKDRLNTGTEPAAIYSYNDVPLFWDAWDVMDYHLETRRTPNYSQNPTVEPFTTNGPIVSGYKWTASFGNETEPSTIERYAILRANSPMIEYFLIIDWKESHKFLKVEFPVDVISREATYEIQYGHVKRPTHINTSWDMAKFEVCGHKWMDISQGDKGVTFITDSKYGWHVHDNIVKLSLVRSPKNPDANCDMHKHYIYYAVLPHEGTFQEAEVIRRAYELNYFGSNNVLVSKAASTTVPQNLINCDSDSIVVEAMKPAHDRSDAILVRFYEAFGGNTTTRITAGFTLRDVVICNGLEDPETSIPFDQATNSFETSFTPFQIQSFLLLI